MSEPKSPEAEPPREKSKKITIMGIVPVLVTVIPIVSGVISGVRGDSIWATASAALAAFGLLLAYTVFKSYGKTSRVFSPSLVVVILMCLSIATAVCALVLTDSTQPTVVWALVISWAFTVLADSMLFIRVKADPAMELMPFARFAGLGGMSAVATAMLGGSIAVALEGILRFAHDQLISGIALEGIAVSLGTAAVTLMSARPLVSGLTAFSAAWVVAGFGAGLAEDKMIVPGIATVVVAAAMLVTGVFFWRFPEDNTKIFALFVADLLTVVGAAVAWELKGPAGLFWLWAPVVLGLGVATYLVVARPDELMFPRANSAPAWGKARYVVVIVTSAVFGTGATAWVVHLWLIAAVGSASSTTGVALAWLVLSVATFIGFLRRPRFTGDDFVELEAQTDPITSA